MLGTNNQIGKRVLRLVVSTESCCVLFGFYWVLLHTITSDQSRVAFFVWTAALRKILTSDNLKRRNVWTLDWCHVQM